jgi:predicted GTPase
MSALKHVENRAWTFGALEQLQAFLGDSDFEGDTLHERSLIDGRHRELHDGKYRVVFLGEFNVGKSTLINAFLGDEYLPTVLEECTAKVTHVLKGDSMRMIIRPLEEISEDELQGLRNFLDASGIDAAVERGDAALEVVVAYQGHVPRELLTTLSALVTVYADEDFPQLRTLRTKFEELVVQLPNNQLEDDVALVDSPGVYSISETNKKITQDIIPNCHLVVCMLDSQSAGNEHNRDFVARIVQERHRKVFFVINKADQLNPSEIDPTGRRGPAKDLFRSLAGIVDDPQLFFVSSLYAMVAGQLAQGRVSLSDVDDNNKVRIPYAMRQQVDHADNPPRAAGEYLLQQSNFSPLQRRLLEYLYTENREGAVVASVCRFVNDTAWRYARPLEVKLELIKNVPKLEKLRQEREQLQGVIERNHENSQHLLDEFRVMAVGGTVDDVRYEGYDNALNRRLSRAVIEQEVLKPLRQWLSNKENLSKAKKNRYQPLQEQLEQTLDAFVAATLAEVNETVEQTESHLQARIGAALGEIEPIVLGGIDATRGNIVSVHAGMGLSYFLYTLTGGILGGAAGAIIGESFLNNVNLQQFINQPLPAVPHLNAVACAAAGLILGAILGCLARSFGGDDARREKLTERITGRVEDILVRDVKEQLLNALAKRKETFAAAVEHVFDGVNEGLNDQIRAIAAEEDRLRLAQQAVIDRLQPKIEGLSGLSKKAREIVETMFGSAASA